MVITGKAQGMAREKVKARKGVMMEGKGMEGKGKQKTVQEQVTGTLLFGKWSFHDVKVRDVSLAKYLNFDANIIPHTFGKHAGHRLGKARVGIVERLVNKTMRSGQGKRKLSGKYLRGR